MIGTGFSPLTMFSARPDSFIGEETLTQMISDSPFQSVYDEVNLSEKALGLQTKACGSKEHN
ncbi:MAG: hypothetical protein AB2L14_13840 [Candidatus Xenobiia bacterium LiM19]